jgi:hypothetical protein
VSTESWEVQCLLPGLIAVAAIAGAEIMVIIGIVAGIIAARRARHRWHKRHAWVLDGGGNRRRQHPQLAFAAVLFALGGCVNQGPPKVAATEAQAIVVNFTANNLSVMSDMPMGTYRVPKSQVLVSGYQTGNFLAIAAGLPWAMFDAADTSGGKSAVHSSEDMLHITLPTEGQRDLTKLLAKPEFSGKFTVMPSADAAVLSISGDIVLQFFDDDAAMLPYVILRARLTSPRRPSWSMRYIASIGPARPFAGQTGWTANDGAALKNSVSAALERAQAVLLKDVSSPYARDEQHKVAVDGYYAFLKPRLRVVGYALDENADWIAFSPILPGTSLLAGVNIMDKSVTTFRPATKEDPRIKPSAKP